MSGRKMSIDSIPISSFMTANVKAEMADQNIHAACKIMHKVNIGSVIVVKEYTDRTCRYNYRKGYCAHHRDIRAITSTFTLKRANE